MTLEWSVAIAAAAEVAERPVWDDATASLVWVDILAGGVHRYRPSDGTDAVVQVGDVVGAAGLRAGGGLVAAADHGVLLLDASGAVDRAIPVPLPSGVRFNDGVVDPWGGFVVGTIGPAGSGSLYRVTPDGDVLTLLTGVTASNGIGWSPDRSTMYYVDSAEPAIRTYDLGHEPGSLGRRRQDLVTLTAGQDIPDGLVVDAAGCVWVALWEGWAVRRYAPDGQLLEHIPVPVSRPTCPEFGPGGTLYLTTGWEEMSDVERSDQPWAGHVLVADASPARGTRAHRFAG